MKIIKQLLVILGIVLIWQITCSIDIFNTYILPPPLKVFNTFIKMVTSGEIIEDIYISFKRVLIGYIISFILAFIVAVISFLKKSLSQYYEFLIQLFRNIPPLSMIPLLILWYGIGEMTKIIIIILASFFPMYLNILKGFKECDKKLLEVGDIFGYSKYKKFIKITLPYAISDILIGMRIGLGYSWRAIIGAEMIAASTGIGHMILFAQQLSRTDKVIIGIITIGIVGYLCDLLFAFIINKCLRGGNKSVWN
ncbi:ABC transporter permease [uncultured Tyzzerella sp.]|uniref:ABC transporter permease n=1 Tax=uncultured Tyzzerella sp. TaxID=2321398 RepID=UPI0029422C60|nr:ABC transporter permease [uncultured Tyzzerella sp.]